MENTFRKILKQQKKQNAKEQQLRQRIDYNDFLEVLNLCDTTIQHRLSRAIIKVGFVLQYCTGLRIGNLLKLTNGMIYELFE